MAKTKQKTKQPVVPVIILSILSIVCVLPMVMVISTSVSSELDIVTNGYTFFPRTIDLAAYKMIVASPKELFNAYKVTIITSAVGTFLSVLIMLVSGYALSRKKFVLRRPIIFYFFFTMLFNGGLTASYLLITRYLHMQDTIWVHIIPTLINPWHIVLFRTYFQGQPEAIIESAKIDGASEFKVLFSILVPISKPIIATITLYQLLPRWNSWMSSMLYITERDDLITLQYLLQKILRDIQMYLENPELSNMNFTVLPGETFKMAMAVAVTGPILVVYPFFQKYFTKGVIKGSIKG